MLYVSFIEIFGKSHGAFMEHGIEERDAYFLATLFLFLGMMLLRLLQFLVHKIDKDHHCECSDEEKIEDAREISLDMPAMVGDAAAQQEGVAAEGSPETQEKAGAASAESK